MGDSVQIANILQRGEWIGNYGVGLHGFINKLVIGIIFILTGPSVFVATLSNIIFGIACGVISYRIMFKHLKFSRKFSLLGVTLLFCSYQIISYIPTFYRDIPALFFLLLILYSILNKKNKWITGIFLMLLLDSKEHVFYTVAPALFVWIGMESFINHKVKAFSCIEQFIDSSLKLFLPSFLFLVLMFTTSILPLNIYNANILGIIKGGVEEVVSNFDLEAATYNRDIAVNKDIARTMPTIVVPDGTPSAISSVLTLVNIILSYIGKILYPRTFSFLSVPFIVLIPSVIYAFKYFQESINKRKTNQLILPLSLFVFLAVYIFHASISRYLIPILPVIFIFYLLFLKDLSLRRPGTKKIIFLSIMFTLAGLYFEYSYVIVKFVINVFLFSILLSIYSKNKWNKDIFRYVLILVISISMAGTSLLASYMYGQIKGYRLYGHNRECEKIVSLVDNNESIWINDIFWDKLPLVLRRENIGNPEWKWELKEWVPKKALLKKSENVNTYNFYWKEEKDFFAKIKEYQIDWIVFIELHKSNEKEKLLMQDRLEDLQEYKWLSLESSTEMKNKTVYLFHVK